METSRAELPKRSYLQYLLGKLKHILTKNKKRNKTKIQLHKITHHESLKRHWQQHWQQQHHHVTQMHGHESIKSLSKDEEGSTECTLTNYKHILVWI